MTKVYGTGTYDFKRHRVAEYPLELPSHPAEKPLDSKPGSNLPSSITLSEIQQDRLTKIAEESWIKTRGKLPEKPFDPEVVKEIYVTELKVTSGRKPVPLQRVMILEVSQYLENYLWPNFDPETATFEHVMSMILMINEKVNLDLVAFDCLLMMKQNFIVGVANYELTIVSRFVVPGECSSLDLLSRSPRSIQKVSSEGSSP